ncbi:DUF6932 family protein [Rhodococcus wratislaviensis]
MIPPLDPVTGHLPLGRYRCTLAEIRARFVDDDQFAGSKTRRTRYVGLEKYLEAWKLVQEKVSEPDVLMGLWIGGSFTPSVIDPDDVDVSPQLNGPKLADLNGKPGVKPLKMLFGHRPAVVKAYGVEPFPFTWYPVVSPLAGDCSILEADYYQTRGSMDDFWQRVRPAGPKRAPTMDDVHGRRGYLEVIL